MGELRPLLSCFKCKSSSYMDQSRSQGMGRWNEFGNYQTRGVFKAICVDEMPWGENADRRVPRSESDDFSVSRLARGDAAKKTK